MYRNKGHLCTVEEIGTKSPTGKDVVVKYQRSIVGEPTYFLYTLVSKLTGDNVLAFGTHQSRIKREKEILQKIRDLKIPVNTPEAYEPKELGITGMNGNQLLLEKITDPYGNVTTLADYIHQHPNDKEQIEKYLGQVGESVGHLHARHVFHGDLSLSNVLINKENKITLIDFGVDTTPHYNPTQGTKRDWKVFLSSCEKELGPALSNYTAIMFDNYVRANTEFGRSAISWITEDRFKKGQVAELIRFGIFDGNKFPYIDGFWKLLSQHSNLLENDPAIKKYSLQLPQPQTSLGQSIPAQLPKTE